MNAIHLETIMAAIENLSAEEQEALFQFIQQRRIERRRSEIANNAKETFASLDQGTAIKGNPQDIKSYLLSN
ncbi:MAG: hypothetical protein GVY04_05785 [Cyanobacteria bacterium]|jgi:hypothetical protein|nr:hypothetical protein [Cyanobacteria bacterium GSL.Bin1]